MICVLPVVAMTAQMYATSVSLPSTPRLDPITASPDAHSLSIAEALWAQWHDVKSRLLQAQMCPYDITDLRSVQDRYAALKSLLNNFLSISQKLEIHLFKISLRDQCEAVKRDKRIIRDRTRQEIYALISISSRHQISTPPIQSQSYRESSSPLDMGFESKLCSAANASRSGCDHTFSRDYVAYESGARTAHMGKVEVCGDSGLIFSTIIHLT